MQWSDLEASFARAFRMSVSKKKWVFTSLVLACQGLGSSLFLGLSFQMHPWISLSALFFSLFFGFFLFGALAIFLSKSYLYELKREVFSYKALFFKALESLPKALSLFGPSFLASCILSLALGVCFLFKEMPWIGPSFAILLSFAAFLLVFLQLALLVASGFLLFWAAPHLTIQKIRITALLPRISMQVKKAPLKVFCLFFLSIAPLFFSCSLLFFPLKWSFVYFASPESSLSFALTSMLLSLSTAPLIAPSCIFFFHFSLESYAYLHPKREFSQQEAPL